jgi:hypothetical protein
MAMKTRAQRARLVAEWRASETTQAAFARQHRIHPRTFFDWVRACPPAPLVAAPAVSVPGRFVPVQLVPEHPDPGLGPSLTIALPTGERLEVSAGSSPAWVAAVVAGLRAPC